MLKIREKRLLKFRHKIIEVKRTENVNYNQTNKYCVEREE